MHTMCNLSVGFVYFYIYYKFFCILSNLLNSVVQNGNNNSKVLNDIVQSMGILKRLHPYFLSSQNFKYYLFCIKFYNTKRFTLFSVAIFILPLISAFPPKGRDCEVQCELQDFKPICGTDDKGDTKTFNNYCILKTENCLRNQSKSIIFLGQIETVLMSEFSNYFQIIRKLQMENVPRCSIFYSITNKIF